jgi:hypothetical protein
MGWLIFFGVILFIFLIYKAVEWENNKKKERSDAMQQKISGIENFTISRKVDGFGGFYIFAIDEINEKIALVTESVNHIVSFSDIIGVELIEDGNTVSKKSTTRTIGGAIVGGVLAGGVGTIVGGLSGNSTQKSKISSLSVKILLRSLDKPSLLITCFDSRTMTTEHKASIETDGKLESYIYKIGKKNADDIKDLVSVIIDRIDNKTVTIPVAVATKPSNSIADELLKLNELKEKGILTEEEFTLQKTKILN